jgi:hypothetical protein
MKSFLLLKIHTILLSNKQMVNKLFTINTRNIIKHLQGPFAKFMDSPYYSNLELCDGLFFEVPPLASNALLTTPPTS